MFFLLLASRTLSWRHRRKYPHNRRTISIHAFDGMRERAEGKKLCDQISFRFCHFSRLFRAAFRATCFCKSFIVYFSHHLTSSGTWNHIAKKQNVTVKFSLCWVKFGFFAVSRHLNAPFVKLDEFVWFLFLLRLQSQYVRVQLQHVVKLASVTVKKKLCCSAFSRHFWMKLRDLRKLANRWFVSVRFNMTNRESKIHEQHVECIWFWVSETPLEILVYQNWNEKCLKIFWINFYWIFFRYFDLYITYINSSSMSSEPPP